MAQATHGAGQRVSAVLIRNVHVFDERAEQLSTRASVRVAGNAITGIGASLTAPPGATIVEGGGRVLLPALIDAHWHAVLGPNTLENMLNGDDCYLFTVAIAEVAATLQRGFTAVRDAAGPVFGLKRAIDDGVVSAPWIYPSGAMISQTSGHGDFRPRPDRPRRFGGPASRGELLGAARIADGPAEVLTAVREQLRLGAPRIKLAAGGGVSSEYDPLEVLEYSFEETQAAVGAARDWRTYVMVHICMPDGVRRAVEAEVPSIEHGQLLDEPTVKLLADTGTWLSTRAFIERPSDALMSPERRAKRQPLVEGTDRVLQLANHYGLKLALGTDSLFSPALTATQTADLVDSRGGSTPAEVLRLATSANAELLALSGPRNPYGQRKLGAIEEGAYADLPVVNGNPREDIRVLERPAENLALIMKDGQVFKNTLS